MNNKKYFPNLMLTGVVALALLVCRVIRTFGPMWVLPQLDIPNIALLSLAALLLTHTWVRSRCSWMCGAH